MTPSSRGSHSHRMTSGSARAVKLIARKGTAKYAGIVRAGLAPAVSVPAGYAIYSNHRLAGAKAIRVGRARTHSASPSMVLSLPSQRMRRLPEAKPCHCGGQNAECNRFPRSYPVPSHESRTLFSRMSVQPPQVGPALYLACGSVKSRDRHFVGDEGGSMSDDCQVFQLDLSDQHAVEWIFMVQVEVTSGNRVTDGYP